MKRQIGIIMAVWLITSAFTAILHADTSYLLIQGDFGSGGAEQSYKWQVNYPTGYLATGQDLLNSVFGAPVADGTLSSDPSQGGDPIFGGLPYYTAGNSTTGIGYVYYASFNEYVPLSFTLNSTVVDSVDTTPLGTSTLNWNYYVSGGGGAEGSDYNGAPYPSDGTWYASNDGAAARTLADGSYDGWVFGDSGYDSGGNPAGATATIDDSSASDNPSDFSNNGPNDVVAVANVPEPTTPILFGAAAGLVALAMRKRKVRV